MHCDPDIAGLALVKYRSGQPFDLDTGGKQAVGEGVVGQVVIDSIAQVAELFIALLYAEGTVGGSVFEGAIIAGVGNNYADKHHSHGYPEVRDKNGKRGNFCACT